MFANTFAIESFMDELAHRAGKDPLQFRLEHCGDTVQLKRRKNLLELIGERSEWHKPMEIGIGRGLAVCDDHKTIAAAVVDLRIEEGQIKILKVFQAIDPGKIINPNGVLQQVEGATMMGISASLFEECTIENGQFVQTNFHNYQVAKLIYTPEIDILMYEGSEKPSGVGEPPISPIAPAIANAIFNLTGIRLRSLPLQKALDGANRLDN
jgi:isoquinoline 1-oxidoreductase subunit beta